MRSWFSFFIFGITWVLIYVISFRSYGDFWFLWLNFWFLDYFYWNFFFYFLDDFFLIFLFFMWFLFFFFWFFNKFYFFLYRTNLTLLLNDFLLYWFFLYFFLLFFSLFSNRLYNSFLRLQSFHILYFRCHSSLSHRLHRQVSSLSMILRSCFSDSFRYRLIMLLLFKNFSY